MCMGFKFSFEFFLTEPITVLTFSTNQLTCVTMKRLGKRIEIAIGVYVMFMIV